MIRLSKNNLQPPDGKWVAQVSLTRDDKGDSGSSKGCNC
jgi:hypothetical protein